MDTNIVLPITPEVKRVTELLTAAISRLTSANHENLVIGEFEADREGLLQLILVVRNVEAVITLAEQDLALFIPATLIARSTFEIAARVLWMLDPTDPFERETRWIAHSREAADFWARFHDMSVAMGKGHARTVATYEGIRQLTDEIESLLNARFPGKYHVPPHMPSLRDILRSLGDEQRYIHYVILSQYTHGTQVATMHYRRHMGNDMTIGEFVQPDDWGFCLRTCWYSLAAPGLKLHERAGGNPSAFLTQDFIDEIQIALDVIDHKSE